MQERLAARLQRGELRHEVVAVDVGDQRAHAEALVELLRRAGAARRIEAARIDHDPDAALHARDRDLLDLAEERARIARSGSFSRSFSRIIIVSSAR